MLLLAIGRAKAGPELELFRRYASRLRPSLDLIEIAQAQGEPAAIRRREAAALLAALPANGFLVALDERGQSYTSQAFAAAIEDWLGRSRPLCFAIGGAEGLDVPVIERADQIVSLGAATWPHMLVRAMLAEQLYRARSIVAGHPYHRVGRA